jgi:protoheme IX farnesyltransferase
MGGSRRRPWFRSRRLSSPHWRSPKSYSDELGPRNRDASPSATRRWEASPLAGTVGRCGSADTLKLQGTIILVPVFFVAVVLYYLLRQLEIPRAALTAALTGGPPMPTVIADLYSLLKLRIGLAIALSALAGAAITPGPSLPAWKPALLVLAVLLASGSAGAFNQYVERDLDARMPRTRLRPFVRGAFHAGPGWLLAIALLLVAGVALAYVGLGGVSAAYVFLGAFVYGVVYTVWLKRRTTLNIVIGGLSGSFAVLAGAAAVDPSPSTLPLLLAAVLFLWTPPHFWSLALAMRDEYAAAGVPMLPVVIGDARAAQVILWHTVALVAVSLLPVAFGLGWIYLAGALTGGSFFVWRSFELAREPSNRRAFAAFHASLIQLCGVLAGAMLDGWFGGW